ncbi:hypothetical protein BaRGS_00019805 [Batillaria attramentaria]|uniref:small monomeric GTPase n=1 Tax=Batillaria attramentaria TaxID=370345 RepID=A0ABD0KPC0_9CAEN
MPSFTTKEILADITGVICSAIFGLTATRRPTSVLLPTTRSIQRTGSAAKTRPRPEVRHRVMAYNGSRLKLSNGGDSKDGTCKIALLGCPGVGKTALTVRFLTKRFIGEYCPTLESVYKYQTSIDDDDVRLEILDTAGQPRPNMIIRLQTAHSFLLPYLLIPLENLRCSTATGLNYWKDGYALWADCFMFVYSITDRDSFQELVQLKRHVESVRKSTSITGILVANKNDLLHDRQVTEAEGEELADEMGCRFYEVSASDGCQMENVATLFHDLYRDYRRARQQREGRQRKTSSSAKFKQAIQKVISGKTPSRRATTS